MLKRRSHSTLVAGMLLVPHYQIRQGHFDSLILVGLCVHASLMHAYPYAVLRLARLDNAEAHTANALHK
jgi:hypothetical protein